MCLKQHYVIILSVFLTGIWTEWCGNRSHKNCSMMWNVDGMGVQPKNEVEALLNQCEAKFITIPMVYMCQNHQYVHSITHAQGQIWTDMDYVYIIRGGSYKYFSIQLFTIPCPEVALIVVESYEAHTMCSG